MRANPYRCIDPNVLLQAVGDDAASFRQLSQTFLRITPPMLAKLEEALRAGNCDKAVLETHSLKSSASLVGAARLAGMFAELEGMARRGDVATAASALPAAADELAQVMLEVRDSVGTFGNLPAA